MAVLAFPNFLSFRLAPSSRRRNRLFICCHSAETGGSKGGPAVLWFKHDLRLDDHPGLVAAARSHRSILPLYVFDRRILSRYSDEMLELVLFALNDLRNSLREQGSNLMIRFGSAESVIADLVKEVKASNVYAEVELEYVMSVIIEAVKKTLEEEAFIDGNPDIVLWQTPFYDTKENVMDLPASHDEFKKLKLSPTLPVPSPTLPTVGMEFDWGSLPSFGDLKEFIYENQGKSLVSWNMIKEMSAETVLQEKFPRSSASLRKSLNFEQSERKRLDDSAFVTCKGNVVGGGTNSVLNALAAYLRYLEGTSRDDWQEVHERLRSAESRDGASFISLFSPALCLGVISRRRVHYEAITYDKERNGGFLSPFGYSAATVAAAADAVSSMEWYSLMAQKSQRSSKGPQSIRIWRWKGYLIQYTVVGREGPATLLVHGFGAFLDHYRDNIKAIAETGKRVWAVTLLGFGKSEKPNVVYTELLWAELLRDFIVEVVGEPVHLVGNSIGGYFVSILACLWPSLVKSVVLINSAGNVIPGFSQLFPKDRRASGAAWLGARFLLSFLRFNLKNTVKSCYPTKPERADDWLLNEMLRASSDPGVLVVLESIFSFDLSLPLNYLLKGFEDKTLIIQGMKDPLGDSKSKVAMLKEHCVGVTIRELDAGHCPHDELPEEVNSIITDWISTVEKNLLPAESCVENKESATKKSINL